MEVLKTISYTDILLVLAQHGLQILLWTIVFAALGFTLSLWLIRKLRKNQWLKRLDGWKYVVAVHYVLIPLTITAFLAYSGFLFGCTQAGKSEVHRARLVLENETNEAFIEQYSELMDTTNLKLGSIDTLSIEVLRSGMKLRPGSFYDKSARSVIYLTRQVLLSVLTNELSDMYGVRKKYLNNIKDAYEAEDPAAMHMALLDVFEYFSWKPFKALILGSFLTGLGVALLVLLLPSIEIFYHGRKYRLSHLNK